MNTTFKTVRNTNAVQVYEGDDFIYTILKQEAGITADYNILYEDADGKSEFSVGSEEKLIELFGETRTARIIEILRK